MRSANTTLRHTLSPIPFPPFFRTFVLNGGCATLVYDLYVGAHRIYYQNLMRFSFVALICASLFLVSFTAETDSPDNETWHTSVGQDVPTFDFQLKNGEPLSIEAYRGRVVLLNFFATWCPPCRQELPRVQAELWDVHGENPAFEILVLAREEGWDKLDPFIEQTGYTFPIVPDLDRVVFSKFATQSIPRNVILDRDGKIIYQSIGYSPEEFGKMVAVIEHELATE